MFPMTGRSGPARRFTGALGAPRPAGSSAAHVVGSAMLGAALMYLLDPRHGRRRRALARDQLVHVGKVMRTTGQATARDAVHRVQGVAAAARRYGQRDAPDDEVVSERVRAVLGRVVSHPHAIRVATRNGRVTLTGPILEDEVSLLVASVGKVPGVHEVDPQLQRHAEAGNVPALQGGEPRTGVRSELMQDNWAPSVRVGAGFLGTGLMAAACRERGVLSALLAAAGGGLLARSATNLDFASLLGMWNVRAKGARRGIVVQKSIHIGRPVSEVFAFWSNYQNFPRFMSRVKEVRPLGENRSRWLVAGPGGMPVEWTSETTRTVPDQVIEWRSVDGPAVSHSGMVRFEPAGDGTRVHVRLCYQPVAGALGHAIACMFGADPKSDMDADLMRLKTLMETGHPPHDAAQQSPLGTAARPSSRGNGHGRSTGNQTH